MVFPRETFLSLPGFDHMHRFLPALVRRDGGAPSSRIAQSVPFGANAAPECPLGRGRAGTYVARARRRDVPAPCGSLAV